METSVEADCHVRVKEFPCAFHLACVDKVTPARLRAVQNNLTAEKGLKHQCEIERIRNNNLLAWIYFRLDKEDESVELNNEVIERTKRKNIASLGNRFYIMWSTGNEMEAKSCLELLEKMKEEENFRELLTEAKAEMAYYYSKLGGPGNLKLAISLFSEAVTENPDIYLWKFGLGLVYRRATHVNIYCSSLERMDVENCKKQAAKYLFEVADNADSCLQAMAYAQLVILRQTQPSGCDPEFDALFRHLSVQQLCENALKTEEMPSVLTHCGKVLCAYDIDESIRLLEKAVTIKKNSMAYHYLGKSLVRKARMLAVGSSLKPPTEVSEETGNQGNISAGWSPKDEIESYVVRYKTVASLNKDDKLIQRARECFKQAIEIANDNFPAVLDLGILLRDTGQINEALTQFNRVTNSHLLTSHRVTLISAYEQAGLCYMQLTPSQEEDGKKKLTIAVSLAADLAVIMPELKDSAQELWTAFRTLENTVDLETPSPNQQKNKIKLLELARDYGQIIEVLQKLKEYNEDQLKNHEIILVALNSFLELKQPENALAFQNLVGIRPDIGDWWTTGPVRDLRIKVLLQAICGRLKDSNENPTVLFHQLFELALGSCSGLHTQETEGQNNPVGDIAGDVLIVYDDKHDSEDNQSPTAKSAHSLKDVATFLFGLAAEENLKGTFEFGDFDSEIQLKETRRYRVVIIVLGSEERDGVFDAMLKCLSYSKKTTLQRILVIDAGLKDGQVPLCLEQYECFKLEDIGGLGDINQGSGGEDERNQLPLVDILKHIFHGDVDAILKLFCFIIGQRWPCL